MSSNKPVKKKPEFWLTNISNRHVSLTDLNLTVKAFSSVNLLDKKHYRYTAKQLIDSVSSGSVFRKNEIIKIRQGAPEIIKIKMEMSKDAFIPSRERSLLVIKEENYEELNVTDEEFADLNADTAEIDSRKILNKG